MSRFRVRAAVAGLAVGLAVLVPSTTPAQAHSGGRAITLVSSLQVEHVEAKQWRVMATVVDGDSGDPVSAEVIATVGSPAQSVTLTEDVEGSYAGVVKPVEPGATQLALSIRTLPGFEGVVPYDRSWPVTLTEGETQLVAQETADTGGGSNVGLIVGVGAGVLVLALLYGLFAVRRRTAAPVPER